MSQWRMSLLSQKHKKYESILRILLQLQSTHMLCLDVGVPSHLYLNRSPPWPPDALPWLQVVSWTPRPVVWTWATIRPWPCRPCRRMARADRRTSSRRPTRWELDWCRVIFRGFSGFLWATTRDLCEKTWDSLFSGMVTVYDARYRINRIWNGAWINSV